VTPLGVEPLLVSQEPC